MLRFHANSWSLALYAKSPFSGRQSLPVCGNFCLVNRQIFPLARFMLCIF